jgi:hypothetical protein
MTRLELLNAFRALNQRPPLAKPAKSRLDEELEAYLDRYTFEHCTEWWDGSGDDTDDLTAATSLDDLLKRLKRFSPACHGSKTVDGAEEWLDKLMSHLKPGWLIHNEYLRNSEGKAIGRMFLPPSESIPEAQKQFDEDVKYLLRDSSFYPREYENPGAGELARRWHERLAWAVRHLDFEDFCLVLQCMRLDNTLKMPSLENVKA